MTPKLETDRLTLSPFVAGFLKPEHVAWLNDPDVVKYSELRHYHHTEESQIAYLNSFKANEYIWLIKAGKTDIGTITAFVDPYNRIADMGILLGNKDAWGKGYASEAWKEVMRFLFEECDIRKIECGTMEQNQAMRRVAVKNKMVVEATRIQHFLWNDEPQAILYYYRLRP